jgi:hypothetical protein
MMLKRFVVLLLLLAALAPLSRAQSLRGDVLFRVTLLRATPGRLLDLIAALRAGGLAAASSKALVLRHAQGDHWDLMVLQPVPGYAQALKEPLALVLAPEGLVSWQEDEFVRGPDIDALPGFREANLYHAEMFHALAGRRAELLKEREMENAYAGLLGRPQTAIFTRELGASWDSFTIGWYRGWKHYAERDDIPKEKSASAAKSAGFAEVDQIGPYLRSLVLDHHDSLLTPVR